jgi:tetratricopeptide (TPR) repeat protein
MMTRIRFGKNSLRTAVAGVIAATMLSGCGGAGGHVSSASDGATRAESNGSVERGVKRAEASVAKSPRDGALRATLGHAYLKSGRFASAAASFNDAMQLGDNSARTALGLSLSYVALGRNSDAVAILNDWRDVIPATDLGLALALAGETSRGTALLADALRNGENTPKLRQNLAYSYALDGRWREARILMEQDVPADQIDRRISDWASRARPEDFKQRIASLLDVPVRDDQGVPSGLALAASKPAEQLASEASAVHGQTAPVTDSELPAIADPSKPAAVPAPAPIPVPVAAPLAAAAPESVAAPAPAPVPAAQEQGGSGSFAAAFAKQNVDENANSNFVNRPLVQPLPSQYVAQAPAPRRTAAVVPVAVNGTHFVQLGSFSSEQGARRAWGIYAKRNPELRSHQMAITAAIVRGQHVWRVAAAGLNYGGARSMCSAVRNRGGACFAYAATNAPAGAIPGRAMRGNAGAQNARR